MSGKNFMSYGDADTILTEFSNDIKSRVSTKANQGLTAQQMVNAKANIDIDKVPNVATNDQTPTFLEESTRTNIASGDKLSLIFGKIKKFFSDLKAVAFSGSYNDLSDTPTLVECSTARNVAAKTVTLPGFKLKTGAKIFVRFTDTGTSNPASGNITLNVNGTGAKEIVDGRANMTKMTYTNGSVFCNNQVNDFIYDGTYWAWTNRDYNTTYSSKAAASGGTATSLCTTGEKYTWNNKANTSDIPTTLSGLSDDSTHRLVTDTEKSTWNGKANKKTTMDSYYGTSSTGADTAAKVITVTDSDGNFSLRAGIAIMVKFTAQNTAQNPTFNVNNTGAKSVWYNTAAITTGNLWAGGNTRPARYVYDGTYWVWMGHAIDNNTTYSAMSKAELTTGTATTLRTVRADYLKAGIEELIDGKIANRVEIQNNAGFHNSFYRGKSLGTSVTAKQWSDISAGTFDDLFIGDYWTINNKIWRIASFDYFLHNGDTACETHHIVIVPDDCLYNAKLNTSASTIGGYVAVKIRGVLTDAETAIKSAFGQSHILSHRVLLTNVVTDGRPSDVTWLDSICDLMNEEMVYGTCIFRTASDGQTIPALYRIEKSQLQLFTYEPSRIVNGAKWWLRDVAAPYAFTHVNGNGCATSGNADSSNGIRPVFCIK